MQKQYTCQCGAVMGYPDSAVLVQCTACSTVTNVAGEGSAIHVPCVNCSLVLAFPPGTKLAACPACKTVFNIATRETETNPAVDDDPDDTEPSCDTTQSVPRGGPVPMQMRRVSVAVPAKGHTDVAEAQTGQAAENQDAWITRAVRVANDHARQTLADEFDMANNARESEWQEKKRK